MVPQASVRNGAAVAHKVQTLFTDDLDGSAADGTVRFGLDGTGMRLTERRACPGTVGRAGAHQTGRSLAPDRRSRRLWCETDQLPWCQLQRHRPLREEVLQLQQFCRNDQ